MRVSLFPRQTYLLSFINASAVIPIVTRIEMSQFYLLFSSNANTSLVGSLLTSVLCSAVEELMHSPPVRTFSVHLDIPKSVMLTL